MLEWSSLARQLVIDETDAKAEAHARRSSTASPTA